MRKSKNPYLAAFIIVTSLFFIWGFITVLVDALIPRLRDVFTLTYFQAGLVQVAFFGAYFTVSLPGGSIISKVGYKRGIVIGLSVMAIGCLAFLPAASLRIFPLFLLALFILAGGMTLLQVAANPYVVALGPEKTASSRLNLSQAFNSLGTAIAPLVAASMILGTEVMAETEQAALTPDALTTYRIMEAEAVRAPFLALGLILLVVAVGFLFIRLPEVRSSVEASEQRGYGFVLQHRGLMLGALGIFVYVGAEVTIGSYIVNYFLHMDIPALVQSSGGRVTGWIETLANRSIEELNPSRIAGTFVAFYWTGAMIGRFIGAGLSRIIPPSILLGVYAVIAALLCVVSATSGGFVAVWSLLAIGLFNSIMFPTIFSLATNSLPHSRSQGSGVLCAAIVGGAVFPPLFGLFADNIGFVFAFIVPALCYGYIAFYGFTRSSGNQLQTQS
ncbi:sugar MFS transporter [Puniceicoccales bacterium CK1056]|uniref:Sugar MFS transporter n=1 Tax=Oceanipulchritudo coccoides TaxID=2706888 RepID=A0A6B2LZU0_9BACT|nr:sugar MFS transporter [Oceanipulchritudo coccoides]NDV61569.1 sugar MFS transporter [Oceanipulchritudo coccoides]